MQNTADSAFDVTKEPRHLGDLGGTLVRAGGIAGVVGIGASVAVGAAAGFERFFFAYLLNFAFFLSLGLGALFLVVLHHLTRTGWSVVLRRLVEGIASTLPFLSVLFLGVLVGMGTLYKWSVPELLAHDPVIRAKTAYLNVPFFLVRWAVFFGLWTFLTRYFVKRSVQQDATGDVALTLDMQKASAPAMLGFALTATFASFDLLMSLDAHWSSTIFGVYFFSGSVVGVIALLTLIAFGLQSAGLLRRAITVEHYHDLGKLLFAFVVFWAYIGFSQYMLIWYVNLPEETEWLLRRQTHGWGWVALVLLFGHFVVPFLALLSRAPKRRPRLLAAAAAWMLAMHWIDLYWLVMPEVSAGSAAPDLVDVLLLVGIGGIMLAAGAWVLRRRALVPERDPRLDESLHFENA